MNRRYADIVKRYTNPEARAVVYEDTFLKPLHRMVAQQGNDLSVDGHLERRQQTKGRAAHIGARAAYVCANNFPTLAEHILDRKWSATDDIVGRGWNSTVIRRDTEVIKYYHYLEPDDIGRAAQMLQRSTDLTTTYLPDFALPQTFAIVPHPNGENDVVAARQTYIDNFDGKNHTDLDLTDTQVRTLVTQSREMLDATGYVVDFNGSGNIGYDPEGNLRMVDPVPFSVVIGQASVRILESLERKITL